MQPQRACCHRHPGQHQQPALWSVPLAFATMVLVSLRGRPPAWASTAMLRLHLDESEPGRS